MEDNEIKLPNVSIYTDGGCKPNPGPGGWAAILKFKLHEKIIRGSDMHTTNNRMELTAAIEALSTLKAFCNVDIYTDSEYLQRGITEWMSNWKTRNWKRKSGSLKNVDLWKSLDKLVQQHQVNWHWVRGHSYDPDNIRVDRLANQSIPGNIKNW